MAVKKVPQIYRTSDGLEFNNEIEAERHEQLVEAKENFDNAFELFGDALAQTQRTADGKLFEFGVCRDYYTVAHNWSGLPRLRKIWFSYLGDDRFSVSENDEISLIHKEANTRTEFKISELYHSEREAKKALLAAQEERMEQWRNEIEQLRAEIEPL